MLNTIFRKGLNLSKMNPKTVNTTDSQRLAAIRFSPSLLFESKEVFKEEALNDFDDSIADANLATFCLGYARLITNGFQTKQAADDQDIKPKQATRYKSFEMIFADTMDEFAKSKDGSKRKNFINIMHILLLNPNLNLSHKFCIDGYSKTGIEHIFSMWLVASEEEKKPLSDLLTHFIAITADISAITPSARLYSAYTLVSLVGYAMLRRFLSHNNVLSTAISVIDIMEIIPMVLSWSTAISVGYFITKNMMANREDEATVNKLSVHPSYLTGTFATGMPFILKPPSIFERMGNKIEPVEADGKLTYEEGYINRKLLLTKYRNLKASIRSAHKSVRQQLDTKELITYYDSLPSPKQLLFDDEPAKAFISFTRRTFSEGNFSSVVEEISSCDGKKQYFLTVYEMVEKGFIRLDLETLYVMDEVFNQVFYGGYKSVLDEATHKSTTDSLNFESFQYSIDTLLNYKDNSGISQYLGPLNNDMTAIRLKLHGVQLNLKKLEEVRKSVLTEFDGQYMTITQEVSGESKHIKKKEERGFRVEDLVQKGVEVIKDSASQAWESKKGYVSYIKVFVCTSLGAAVMKVLLLKPTLTVLGACTWSAYHYYHPQIKELKNFCSSRCNVVNGVYQRIKRKEEELQV